MARTASPAAARGAGPLAGLRTEWPGPPGPGAGVVAGQLRLLGAEGGPGRGGHVALSGAEFGEVSVRTAWGKAEGVTDEATVQAATGVMAVHGRRDGAPRGLAVDYAATAAGVLAVQALLAALLAQARGTRGRFAHAEVSAERAGLLAVSQYLAAAGADEGEAVELAPGGPPFTSGDGVVFELEALEPGGWAAFWRALGAPEEAVRRGWRPFQFRYATACAPFSDALHQVVRACMWERIKAAADAAGADVCPLHALTRRAAEDDGAPPWTLTPHGEGRTATTSSGLDAPLAGLTVLEAGRRIQAPLAAHLLGLLGAEVVRIEPPGGDPLRGMPPACSGISARWLALNRGKKAVEVDIKSPADRGRLHEMAGDADVFLHNWAPGKAAALGLDREHLAAAHPGLVYAYTGGWADRIPGAPVGTDFMVQARTGVGEAARPADEQPAPSLMTLLDVLGGLLGAQSVLAALLLRERTGRGVRADSSLLGAADLLTAPARARAVRGEPPRRPAGYRRPLPTRDGGIAPADTCADAVAARYARHRLARASTAEALARLHAHGLTATAVTTDLAGLPRDPRFAGLIRHDAHGSLAVPDPWRFA
ncbi:CoA transferase [Streptomyces synnematoformans]|uniref:CoA transferase n=1 Tax=Streptomyces synnematoformans TaxID=415721 RepID=A0ABN2X7V0_9ACTN